MDRLRFPLIPPSFTHTHYNNSSIAPSRLLPVGNHRRSFYEFIYYSAETAHFVATNNEDRLRDALSRGRRRRPLQSTHITRTDGRLVNAT